jgi:hypothetical protein
MQLHQSLRITNLFPHAQLRTTASGVRVPLRQAAGSAAAAAGAAAQLADEQAALSSQLQGCREVLGALQAVVARQFQVCTMP